MKVSVIGTGYVGLVSGVCLAEVGHEVVCVDKDHLKVERINAGESPIFERGLDELLQRHVGHRLRATTDLAAAVATTDVSLIAVGTPFDGSAIDLGFIEAVCAEIGAALAAKDDYHVVVVKSTVVPGTTEDVALPILESASGKVAGRDFGVGMNPEFLKEGEAVADFMNPDRIVLGGIDDRTREVLAELYAAFPGVDVVPTTCRTAEMIKYTANSLLATLISFSNEVGNLCDALGDIDVTEVMRGVHLDKRFSPLLADGSRVTPGMTTYIEAGCGFGGSCFPKDVKALIAHGRRAGEPMALLDSVIAINERQPRRVLELIRRHFDRLADVRVCVLGLAFKPGTDDMRESPSIPVVVELLDAGADVVAWDPIAVDEARHVFADSALRYADTMAQAIDGVDVVVIMTRWPEIDGLPQLLQASGAAPLVVDGRRMLAPDSVEHYEGIGRRVGA